MCSPDARHNENCLLHAIFSFVEVACRMLPFNEHLYMRLLISGFQPAQQVPTSSHTNEHMLLMFKFHRNHVYEFIRFLIPTSNRIPLCLVAPRHDSLAIQMKPMMDPLKEERLNCLSRDRTTPIKAMSRPHMQKHMSIMYIWRSTQIAFAHFAISWA